MWDEVYGTFAASTMALQHHLDFTMPLKFPKNPPPPAQVKQCKRAPMFPSTAYQGAKSLCIHMIWMWDAVCKLQSLNHDLKTSLGLHP